MEQQKYIRIKKLNDVENVFILFSPAINHSDIFRKLGLSKEHIISAGFVSNKLINGKQVAKCHGHSVTLKIQSAMEDTEILQNSHYRDTHEGQKYIRLESFDGLRNAIILLPKNIEHVTLTEALGYSASNVVSAGFVSNNIKEDNEIKPECHGHSFSLNRPSFEDDDTRRLIIQHYDFLLYS